MLHENAHGMTAEAPGRLCEPDPEEMIGNIEKQKSQYHRALELLAELDALEVGFNIPHEMQHYSTMLVGSCHVQIGRCEKQIAYWMDKIDRPDPAA